MQTRCPACTTTFRITPEQLAARGGKVRCGRCQQIFDANAHLLPEEPAPATDLTTVVMPLAGESPTFFTAPPPIEFEIGPEPSLTPPPTAPFQLPVGEETERIEPSLLSSWSPSATAPAPAVPTPPPEPALPPAESPPPRADRPLRPPRPARTAPVGEATEVSPGAGEVTPPTPGASTEASDTPPEEAVPVPADGIMPRELTEVPGYSKWAEAAVAAPFAPAPERARWPFVLAILLLVSGLCGQVLYQYRTDVSVRFPFTQGIYRSLGVDVPLPARGELVSIEGSDLQSDATRGLLSLQITLRNRAAFAQALPNLELTLTDAQDKAVARKVFHPKDYLESPLTAFAPGTEVSARLWLDARPLDTAGYRLEIFYP